MSIATPAVLHGNRYGTAPRPTKCGRSCTISTTHHHPCPQPRSLSAAVKEGYRLAVLMAEQNFAQAIRIADRGYVIVHGRTAFAENSAAELNDNELIRRFYLGV